jgi:hypothetical protein
MTGTDLATSVGAEIAAIEETMRTDLRGYFKDENLQARHRELIDAQQSGVAPSRVDAKSRELREIEREMANRTGPYWRGAKDENGETALQRKYRDLIEQQTGERPDPAGGEGWRMSPAEARQSLDPDLVAEWGESFDANLRRAQDVGARVIGNLGDREAQNLFISAFDGLSAKTQAAIIRELARPEPGYVLEADSEVMEAFRQTPGGAQTIAIWGRSAPRRVGIAMDRFNRVLTSLSGAGTKEFDWWWSHSTPRERQLMLWALATQ